MRDETPRAFPTETFQQEGMSLRDYFAAKVMQAIIGRAYVSLKEAEVALVAYKMADAMLEARK